MTKTTKTMTTTTTSKTIIGFISKTTALSYIMLLSIFLWRSLHCTTMTWNLLIFKAVFYGGHECATINFPFSFWTWIKSLRIQLQEKLPSFDQLKESTRHDKVWKDTNSFFSDIFPTTVVIKKMVSLQNRTAQIKRRGQQNVCVWQIWQGENLWLLLWSSLNMTVTWTF